ncbi:FACT complex subunit SPT16-like isoform X2 [Schistocerca gregaria]|uniref:FACT complex subunit SPT16-like isoform X2 n=1 Tax=Schistocerca gregaria TaxID=7010 RepID=UPI00211F07BD|nr:FACT complex subunit SPT16-like isoform X2 [Schistocerca gregaria]
MENRQPCPGAARDVRRLGVVQRDAEFMIESWRATVNRAGFEQIDVEEAWSNLFAIKEENEVQCTRTSAMIASSLFKKVIMHMETIIDEGSLITHDRFVEEYILKYFANPALISKQLSNNAGQVSSALVPVVQSGSECSLDEPFNSNSNMHFKTIIIELGVRFKSLCTSLARTYMIDANKVIRKTYNFTLELQTSLIALLVPGTVMSTVYKTAVQTIQESRPQLQRYFVKACGWSVGVEAEDSLYRFSEGCSKTLRENMVVQVRVGFANVPIAGPSEGRSESSAERFSVLLSDTVLVTSTKPEVLTRVANKYTDNSYSIQDEEDQEEVVEVKVKDENKAAHKKKSNESNQWEYSGASNAEEPRIVTRRSTRVAMVENSDEEAKRQIHQKQLAIKQREEMLKRYANGDRKLSVDKPEKAKDSISYNSGRDYPPELRRNRIYIDMNCETVFFPLFGQSVPFHIRTIKSAVKSEDYLKVTFRHPGAPQADEVFKDPSATFVKEILFHVADTASLNEHTRLLNELKKRVQDRESEKKAIESLVVQEPLQKSLRPGPKLGNLFIRPSLGGSSKVTGVLEVHQNGFRYTTSKRAVLDVIYKNIKYAFFQPAENDAIVLIHFHLYHAIMIGKKKSFDVQFYDQVIDTYQDSGAVTSWNDNDEIEREQRERDHINNQNKRFKNFVEEVETFSGNTIEFERPYRDLGFYGVYGRENVFLMPTMNCLISLIQIPFFILPLDEVEVVFFERVHFSIRNIDITFVLKDYYKPPIHLSTINRESLHMIKRWLDSCNTKYYSSKANLNWKSFMERIRRDCLGFWEDGGWDTYERQDESDESDSKEDEEEEDFEPSGSDSEDYDCYLSEDDEEVESEEDDEIVDSSEEENAWPGSKKEAKNKKKARSWQDEEDRNSSKKKK